MKQVWTTGYIPNNNSFCYQKFIPKLLICLILPIAIISAFIIFAATSALPTPPTTTTISPNASSTIGGAEITITGNNFISDLDLAQISAATNHALAIDILGNLYIWGYGGNGLLATGTTTTSSQPVPRRINVDGNGDISDQTRFKAVATGTSFSVALDTDGNVYTWGLDSNGQLGNGDGSTATVTAPQRINVDGNGAFSSTTTIESISAGSGFTLAVDTDGIVYAWGLNSASQIGDGTTTSATAPIKITGNGGDIADDIKITAIAAGTIHSLALDNNGTVYAWGSNTNGRTGLGTSSGTRATPATVFTTGAIGPNTVIKSISAGDLASYAIDEDGHLYAWGSDGNGQLGNNATTIINAVPAQITGTAIGDFQAGTRIAAVTSRASTSHVLAIDTAGNLYAWGMFTNGKLGIGNTSTNQTTPKIVNFNGNGDFTDTTNTKLIATGVNNTYAIDADGQAYAWGAATNYMLANNDTTNTSTAHVWSPINITTFFEPSGRTNVTLSDGNTTPATCRITNQTNTKIICLTPPHAAGPVSLTIETADGIDTTVDALIYSAPFIIHTIQPILGSTAGGDEITLTGRGFENGMSVMLGDANCENVNVISETTLTCTTTPRTAGLTDVIASKSGLVETLERSFTFVAPAVLTSVTPNEGPGDGGTIVDITGSDFAVDAEIVQIASGGTNFSMAVDNFGNLYGWGAGSSGVLGNGSTALIQTPVRINVDGNGDFTSKTQIKSIALGYQHSVALDIEGNIYTWGYNSQGMLGDGTDDLSRAVPMKINVDGNGDFSSNTKIQAIAAGYHHTLAIDTEGNIYAWGRNANATLGDGLQGDTYSNHVPIKITGNGGAITDDIKIIAIAAGQQQSLALDENSQLYAWGLRGNGALGTGNGTGGYETKPVRTATTGDITSSNVIRSIAANGSNSYAIDSNGNIFAWGDNTRGQVGDGAVVRRISPFKVNVDGNGDFTSATRIKSVAAQGSGTHVIAIDTAGNSYSWGEFTNGALGLGDNIDANQLRPVKLNFDTNGAFSASTKLITAGTGQLTSFAIDDDNRIYSWGRATSYVLGNGSTTPNQWSPVEITARIPVAIEPIVVFAGQDDNAPATCFFPTVSGSGTTLQCTTSRHGGGPVNIEITKGTITSTLPDGFTYIVPLSAVSIYPTNGLTTGGTLVTITGSGFDNTTTVMIGDKPCTGRTIRLSGTEISCITPEHAAGLVNVVISGNGQTAILRNSFLFNNPLRVNSIDPDFGLVDGGTDVTITGGGFSSIGVPIVQISAGSNYSLALDDNGNVYAWGSNSYGQLGNNRAIDAIDNNGTTCESDVICAWPVKISGLAGGDFADSPRIVAISAGTNHALAVDEDGAVYAWGATGSGRLGVGPSFPDSILMPTKITGLPDSILTDDVRIIKVIAADIHSYAIDNQGQVYAWGSRANYRLGDGLSTPNATLPVRITSGDLVTNPRIVDIASKGSSVVALDSLGKVYTWGASNFGQSGTGSTVQVTTPTIISGLAGGDFADSPRIVDVTHGGNTIFALDDQGVVYGWGQNILANPNATRFLGIGSEEANILWPTRVTGVAGSPLTNDIQIVSIESSSHTLAIDSHGNVWGWGNAQYGKPGNGSINNIWPAQSSGKPNGLGAFAGSSGNPNIIATTAGASHSMAIDAQGNVYTWGSLSNGQLGDGSISSNRPPPAIISGLVGGAFENLTLSVTFDKGGTQDAPCTITSITDTTISCTTSSHTTAEWVAVTVENRINSVTKDDFFEYQLPFINLAIDGGNTIDLAITPSLLGSITSASKTLIARTNHPTGYYMDISMSTTDNSLRKGTDAIAPITGSITTPIALTANSWGFALPSLQSNLVTNGFDGTYDPESSNPLSSSVWAPVPSIDTPFKIKATAVPNARTDDPTEIFFGARADLTLPAGVYGGVVVVSVVENL